MLLFFHSAAILAPSRSGESARSSQPGSAMEREIRPVGHAQQRRPCAGDTDRGRAALLRLGSGGGKAINQRRAVGLVEAVIHGKGEQFRVAVLQRAQQQRTAGDVEYRVRARDRFRQNAACQSGGKLKGRDQRCKEEPVADREAPRHRLPARHGGHAQSAVEGGGDVVGVALHLGGQQEQLIARKAELVQLIGGDDPGADQSRGGSQPARDGDGRPSEADRHAPVADTAALKHAAVGAQGQVVLVPVGLAAAEDFRLLSGLKTDFIIKLPGDAEAVKARTQIGGAGRNTNDHSGHLR